MKSFHFLLGSVRDELQLDLYALYENDETKHDLGTDALIGLIVGLLGTYLGGLLDLEELGKERARKLKVLIARIKNRELAEIPAVEAEAKSDFARLQVSPPSDEALIRANEIIVFALVESGCTPNMAAQISRKVSAEVRLFLKS